MNPLDKRSAGTGRQADLQEVLISRGDDDEDGCLLEQLNSSAEPEGSPLLKSDITVPLAAFRPGVSRKRVSIPADSSQAAVKEDVKKEAVSSSNSSSGLPPKPPASQPAPSSPVKHGILKKGTPEPLTVEVPSSRPSNSDIQPGPSTSQLSSTSGLPSAPSAASETPSRAASFNAAAKPPKHSQSHSFSAAAASKEAKEASLASLPPSPADRSNHARSMLPAQSGSWTSQRQGFSAQIEGKTSMLNGLQYLESPDSIPKDSFRIPAAGNSGRRLQKKPSAGQPHSSDDGSGRNINLDCFDEPTKKGLEDNNESKPEPEKDDDADSMSPTEVADDVENEPKKKKSRWRRWKFWRRELPIAVSLVLMATTVTLYVMQRNLIVGYFALWRWTLFFSLFGPVYIVSHAIMHSLVSFMETHFLATRRMLYYIIGMRKGVERLLRAGLIIGIFAAIFQDRARVRGVRDVYTVLLRLLCCIVLFASANVVKTLLAKLMSSHFYQETHFQKMQDALRKEFFLLALSQPRHDMGDPEEAESPGRPTGMAGLRTKSFAAVSRFMTRKSITVHQPEPEAEEAGPAAPPAAAVKPSAGSMSKAYPSTGKPPLVKPSARSVSVLASARGTRQAAEQGPRGASFSHMRSPLAPATATPSSAPTSPKGGQASYTTGSKGGSELPQRQPQRAAPSFTRTASMQSQRSYKSDDRKSLQSLASMMTDGKAPSARGRSRLAFARVGTQEKVDAQKAAMPVSLPSKPSQDHDFIAKLHMVEKHIRKNKLKLTFSDQLGRAQHASNDVSSQSEAKKLAFYIFWNVKSKHDRNHVVKEDFHPFLSKDRIDEAFETLDLDKDGKISLGDMRDSVLKIYQNRKNLALTLKDTKTVVGKLERIFGGCIHFLFVFFYLTIWGVDLSKVWFTTSSMLLSFVFVFGNSIRSVYESVVFLFVVHPFDVGDGVLVGQSQDYCVVEEIALLNTTLLRWDGARILYPNSKLNSDQLINVSRSANKGEVFKVLVDIGTPKSVFDSIDASLKDFVKGNPDFNNVSCNPGSPADPYKFTLSIYYELSFNSSDRGRYGGARIGIYWAIIEALAKENLQYTLPPYRSGPSDAQPLPTPHAGAGATGLPVLM